MAPTTTTRNVGDIHRMVVNNFVNHHVDLMREQDPASQEQQPQQSSSSSYHPPKPLRRLEKIGEEGEEDSRSYSSTADASTSASSIDSYQDDTSGGGNSSSAAAVRISSNSRQKHVSKLRSAEHRVQVMNDVSSVSSYELDETMSMDLSSKGTGFSEWDNDSLGHVLSAPPTRAALRRGAASPGSHGVEEPPYSTASVSSASGPPMPPRNRHTELATRIHDALRRFDQVSDRVRNMDTDTATHKNTSINSHVTSVKHQQQATNPHSLDAYESNTVSRSPVHHPHHAHSHHNSHGNPRRSSHAVPNPEDFVAVAANRTTAAVPNSTRSSSTYDYNVKEVVELALVDTSSSATHSSSSCTMAVSNHFERNCSDLEDDDTVQAKVEDDESEISWRWPIFLCCFICLMLVIVVLVASIVIVTVVEVNKHKTTTSAANTNGAYNAIPVQPPVTAPVVVVAAPVRQPVMTPVAPVSQPVVAPVVAPTAPVTAPVEAPVKQPAMAAPVKAPVKQPAMAPVKVPVKQPVATPTATPPTVLGVPFAYNYTLPNLLGPAPVQSPVQQPTAIAAPTVSSPTLAGTPHAAEQPTVNNQTLTTLSNQTLVTALNHTNSSLSAFNDTQRNSSTLPSPSGRRHLRA